jgi:hypothetical protein
MTLQDSLRDWSWLMPEREVRIVDISCLGDIIFETKQEERYILDVNAGEIRPFNDQEQKLMSGIGNIIKRFEAAGLKLGHNQCFGFKPHAIFKEYEPENMYVATLNEYVSFMGDFHRQIKGLPDGTAVELKVKQ